MVATGELGCRLGGFPPYLHSLLGAGSQRPFGGWGAGVAAILGSVVPGGRASRDAAWLGPFGLDVLHARAVRSSGPESVSIRVGLRGIACDVKTNRGGSTYDSRRGLVRRFSRRRVRLQSGGRVA